MFRLRTHSEHHRIFLVRSLMVLLYDAQSKYHSIVPHNFLLPLLSSPSLPLPLHTRTTPYVTTPTTRPRHQDCLGGQAGPDRPPRRLGCTVLAARPHRKGPDRRVRGVLFGRDAVSVRQGGGCLVGGGRETAAVGEEAQFGERGFWGVFLGVEVIWILFGCGIQEMQGQ